MKITLTDKKTGQETTIKVVEVGLSIFCKKSVVVTEESGLGWTFSIEDYGFKIGS